MSIDDIRRQMADAGLDTVRLQFPDILGMVKSVSLPLSQLPAALSEGTWFDGSAIEGFARVSESDMVLRPDLNTFAIVPQSRNGRLARLFCSVSNPDGSASETDPRQRLQQLTKAAAGMGFRYLVAPEIEYFFLTEAATGDRGRPRGADRASYFDQAAGSADTVREEAVRRCLSAGIPIAGSHHEVAGGQHEIDLSPLDVVAAADAVITLRSIVREAAQDAGVVASFLPKPFAGESGSGMHTHQSLLDGEGKEVFFDAKDAYGLSRVARGFLAGQLEHARGICAIVAPLVNSYKRLGAFEAPALVSWARNNRSALIRIPAAWQANSLPTRIELRSPDPAANPYLAFGVMLTAGMDGIDRQLLPPEPVEELPSLDFEPGRAVKHRLAKLPGSLSEALDALREDEVICEALGDSILHHFLDAKEIECEEYRRQVTPWELDRYLALY